jgi:hypothetical protein
MEAIDALPRDIARLIRQVANDRAAGRGDSTRETYRKTYRMEKTRLAVTVAEWMGAGHSVERVVLRLRNMHAPARKLEMVRKLAAAIKGVP